MKPAPPVMRYRIRRAFLRRDCRGRLAASALEVRDRARESLVECHARLVAEKPPRPLDVGHGVPNVARACGLVLGLDVDARRDGELLDELVERYALAAGDVERLAAYVGRFHGENGR